MTPWLFGRSSLLNIFRILPILFQKLAKRTAQAVATLCLHAFERQPSPCMGQLAALVPIDKNRRFHSLAGDNKRSLFTFLIYPEHFITDGTYFAEHLALCLKV